MTSRKHSLITLTLLLAACASPARRETVETTLLDDSSIEIDYSLGHSQRRLLAEARAGVITGQNYLDRQILREGRIEPAKYSEFFRKASEFATRKPSERAPAQESPACQNPFILKIKLGASTTSLSGCRSADDGGLSRLVKDGEFLLFTRK